MVFYVTIKRDLGEKGHIKKIKRVYEYNDSFVVLYGIGENGFIVSAYPINKDKL